MMTGEQNPRHPESDPTNAPKPSFTAVTSNFSLTTNHDLEPSIGRRRRVTELTKNETCFT